MPEPANFKANIYGVTVKTRRGGVNRDADPGLFQAAVNRAMNTPRADRGKDIYKSYYRLEDTDRRDGLILLNFVTLRHLGPGRARRTGPARPMGLNADEEFAHQRAALYDHEHRLLFAEAGAPGIGPGTLSRYFKQFADRRTLFLLDPEMDRDATSRARTHQEIQSVEMRVAVGEISSEDREAGLGLTTALAQEFGGSTMDIVIKVNRQYSSTLSVDRLWGFITNITRRTGQPNPVKKLRTKGRRHSDDPLELIDLFQHREKRERELLADDTGRNVPHEERWSALESIREEYLDLA